MVTEYFLLFDIAIPIYWLRYELVVLLETAISLIYRNDLLYCPHICGKCDSFEQLQFL